MVTVTPKARKGKRPAQQPLRQAISCGLLAKKIIGAQDHADRNIRHAAPRAPVHRRAAGAVHGGRRRLDARRHRRACARRISRSHRCGQCRRHAGHSAGCGLRRFRHHLAAGQRRAGPDWFSQRADCRCRADDCGFCHRGGGGLAGHLALHGAVYRHGHPGPGLGHGGNRDQPADQRGLCRRSRVAAFDSARLVSGGRGRRRVDGPGD